jgi:GTP pyrophosphokinase
LHDVVEDTDTSLRTINSIFGEDVAYLVDGMTADHHPHHPTYKRNHREKIVDYSLNDKRINIIMAADRAANIRTINGLVDRLFETRESRQKRILESTKEFIMPRAYVFCPGLYKHINRMVMEFNLN